MTIAKHTTPGGLATEPAPESLPGPANGCWCRLAFSRGLKRGLLRAGATAVLLAVAAAGPVPVRAQSGDAVQEKRQIKNMVQPNIPDLAKKMNLSGTVRIEVVIAPNGTVKTSKVLGGHPLLAQEGQHASEKSTFVPGPRETTEVIEFKF
jgi:TonB family protein